MAINCVTLLGNLTRDPELRFLPKGTAAVKITVACSRKWTTDGGEKKEETTFVDCEGFGRQAELIGEHFRKGELIWVQGRLVLDTWEDKATGDKRSKMKVVLTDFQFLKPGNGSKRDATAPDSPDERPPFD